MKKVGECDSKAIQTGLGFKNEIERVAISFNGVRSAESKKMHDDLVSLCAGTHVLADCKTVINSDVDLELCDILVNDLRVPQEMKDILKAEAVPCVSGLTMVATWLNNFYGTDMSTADTLRDAFKVFPAVPGNSPHVLKKSMMVYAQYKQRLANMKYIARTVECLQALKSMTVNLKVVVRKIENMELDLDHSIGEQVNTGALEKYLVGLGNKWDRDFNLTQELAALSGKKVNLTQPQTSPITPTVPKRGGKGGGGTGGAGRPSAGKVDCFYHLDFGHEMKCPIPGCNDRKLHDAAKAGQCKDESYAADGSKLCPYLRRMGKCTSPKCEFCVKPSVPFVAPMARAVPTATTVVVEPGVPSMGGMSADQFKALMAHVENNSESKLLDALKDLLKGERCDNLVANVVTSTGAVMQKTIASQSKRRGLSVRERLLRCKPLMALISFRGGYVIDSGANVPVAGSKSAGTVMNKKDVTGIRIGGISGGVSVESLGTVSFLGDPVSNVHVSSQSSESVVPTNALNDTGKTVIFAPNRVVHVTEKPVLIPSDAVHIPQCDDGLYRIMPDAMEAQCIECPVSGGTSGSSRFKTFFPPDWVFEPVCCLSMQMSKVEYLEHCKKNHPYDDRCDVCVRSVMTKRAAKRRPADAVHEEESHGAVLGLDTVDGLPADLNGYTDLTVGTMSSSAWGGVHLMKSKAGTEIVVGVNAFESELKRLSNGAVSIKRVHSDGAKELNKGAVGQLCEERGWTNTNSGGYRSNANGKTERYVRTLFEKVRSALITATGGDDYYEDLWGLAVKYAAHILVRTKRSGAHGKSAKSPYEELTGKEYMWGSDDLIFGCYVLSFVAKPTRDNKTSPVADRAIWVGRCDSVSGGHWVVPIVWDATNGRWDLKEPIVATTVKVKIDVFPLKLVAPEKVKWAGFESFMDKFDPPQSPMCSAPMPKATKHIVSKKIVKEPVVQKEPTKDDASGVFEVEAIVGEKVTVKGVKYMVKWKGHLVPTAEPAVNLKGGASQMLEQYLADKKEREVVAKRQAEAAQERARRSRARKRLVQAARVVYRRDAEIAVQELMKKQRMPGAAEDYVPGYEKELSEVMRMRLRELVGEEKARVKRDKIAIRLRMMLEHKRDGRKKGRLLLQGFREPFAWDRGQTDSPVANLSTVRSTVLSDEKCKVTGGVKRLSSADVSKAFLKADNFDAGDHERFVYLREHKLAEQRIFQLLGPLYGQRSASRRWHKTIARWLTDEGYVQGRNDPCVFYKPDVDHLVILWVDDVLSHGVDAVTAEFYKRLDKKFGICEPTYLTDETPLDFVSFIISQETIDGKTYRYMDQERAVTDFVNEYGPGMSESVRSVTCPMPNKYAIGAHPELLAEKEKKLYQSMLGAINYFVSTLRYDIAHPVSRLSQFSANPTVGSMDALMRVVAYLGQTASFCIGGCVTGVSDHFDFMCDSDHGGDRVATLKSYTGMMFFQNGIPVHWRSNKQPMTTDSSAAAEVYALSQAVKEARYFVWKAGEMGLREPEIIKMMVDNAQAISFQHRTCPHTKLKGVFDLRWDWVKDLQDDGGVTTAYINTKDNVADLLTKCHQSTDFNRLVQLSQCANRKFSKLVNVAQVKVCFTKSGCDDICFNKRVRFDS